MGGDILSCASMAAYSFVTRWRVEAPIDRVFETIADVERWPSWWRGVRSVQLLARGDEQGIGTVHRYDFRSALPYSLVFEVRDTEIVRPTSLAGESSGELLGIGRWTLTAEAEAVTHVRYDWNIRTTRWWMNLLAPVSRGVFTWNHDVIMDWGREGLARELGVPVTDER
jgi:uncharacterized protein YndB with AHSA1/START domain